MTRLILRILLQSLHFRAAERTGSIFLYHPHLLGITRQMLECLRRCGIGGIGAGSERGKLLRVVVYET